MIKYILCTVRTEEAAVGALLTYFIFTFYLLTY